MENVSCCCKWLNLFPPTEYQCVTSEDYVDQSGNRLYPPAEDPVVVDVTGTITYSCASNMFLADFTTSLEVPCGSGLNFGYDDTKKCRELCADDPPTPDGVQNTIPDRHHNEHGYWEETTVRCGITLMNYGTEQHATDCLTSLTL